MIIAVTSQKGGVSKTTTAVSLASRLAERHDRVVLADLDQQGHAAICLGRDPESGIFDWMVGRQSLCDVWRRTYLPQLRLVPGNSRTKTVERVFAAEPDPLAQLSRILAEIHYVMADWLVLDTPAAGLMQEAAIAAAQVIVIPVRTEYLGVDGVNATLALVDRLNPEARVILLPTLYDARLTEHKTNLALLSDLETDLHVAEPIPARIAVAEAVAAGQTVWTYPGRNLESVRAAYDSLITYLEDLR